MNEMITSRTGEKFYNCCIHHLGMVGAFILKVLALVASKFKNSNGTDYANSWLRSRYNQ